MTSLEKTAAAAKEASRLLAGSKSPERDRALEAMANALLSRRVEWLSANALDLEKARENGMSKAMLDRLALTEKRIDGIAAGIRSLIPLPDPIGGMDQMTRRPNGLLIGKRRVPLGLIAIIYEARPNVTADAAALCLKAGNACLLRGGSEALCSNQASVRIMQDALKETGLPPASISLVEDPGREAASQLMHMNAYIDVLIPRGGKGLIRAVAENATVPVIRTGEGVCHIYIDRDANISMGAEILYNAKCSRPSVCNAAECVLIHRDVAESFLKAAVPLLSRDQVELRCDPRALPLAGDLGRPTAESDWDEEYNDYILAVRIVDSFEEAVDFINHHGTGHSECIVTENYTAAQRFLDDVDAAAVYVNASTRFTDGGEFGLGAEIGISTQKLHARGPMGLSELTSIKYVIYGNGQIRA